MDDDADIRLAWSSLLEAEFFQVKSFASAEDFLDQANLADVSCLLLDLKMPGMGGQKLLETIRKQNVVMPIIMVSGHADIQTVIETMKLGVFDFLLKPVDSALLLERIRQAMQDGSVEKARKAEENAASALIASLTDRECDVLRLLVKGKAHKQIADDLNLSIRTIEHHRAHINLKLSATSLADLVRTALLARFS